MKTFTRIIIYFIFAVSASQAMAQYCTPTYSTGCTYGDGISLFQLGTINQSILCTNWYHDYTAASTNLTIGNSATITVQGGYSSTYASAWIDYNHNNTFDATELVGQVIISASGTNYTVTFTPPVTALTGATRLRIMTEWLGYPSGPCTGQTYGNCCDFTVILASSGLVPPTVATLAATAVSTTSATLNGTVNANNTSTTTSFEYGLTVAYGSTISGAPTTVTGNTTATVTANLTGLPTSTLYHYRIKGVNAAGTSYGSDQTFTTQCLAAGPAGTITGPGQVCNGGTGYVYSVPAITNAIGYAWTLPYGAVITAGANTNSITVSFPNPSYSGNVVVYGIGCASNGSISGIVVNVNDPATPTLAGPVSACQNVTGNIYTTEPGKSNYSWLVTGGTITAGGTASSNTATVTWTSSGTQCISVNYTNAAGCAGLVPASVCANVSPLPVPAIAGDANPCTGIPTVYATQTGMTNYTWTASGGGTITSGANTSNATIVWNTAGSKTLSLSYTNANGCTNTTLATFAVTVKQGPSPTVSGPGSVCVSSGYLTYTTETGMTGYSWTISPGGTIVAGQGTNSVMVSWNNSGSQSVSVNYTNSNGCAAPVADVFPVTVNALPGPAGTINGDETLCQGTMNVPYSVDPIQDAMTYIWTVPAGAVIASGQNTNSIVVDFSLNSQSGPISVYGNNICGNGTTSPALQVTLNDIPEKPVITLDNSALTSNTPDGNQWYHDGAVITGATGQSYEITENGWYWDVVTLNGCSSDTSNNIAIFTVGIPAYGPAQLSVNPVPNNGKFILSINTLLQENFEITIFNVMGASVYQKTNLLVNNTVKEVIDLRPVAPGLYTLVLSCKDFILQREILVVN